MPAIVKYLPPIEHTVVREGLECRGCWPRWLLEPWIRGRQHSSATEPAAGVLFYIRWWASSALHCIALHRIAGVLGLVWLERLRRWFVFGMICIVTLALKAH